MVEKSGRERTRHYREQRHAAGYREATVWLDPDIKSLIDAEVASGRYDSRSDALAAAAHAFFKEKPRTMV